MEKWKEKKEKERAKKSDKKCKLFVQLFYFRLVFPHLSCPSFHSPFFYTEEYFPKIFPFLFKTNNQKVLILYLEKPNKRFEASKIVCN